MIAAANAGTRRSGRPERCCANRQFFTEEFHDSYASRILRLALLAPDIVEAILVGRTDQTLMLEKLERPLPASWMEQRARILEPKGS